MSEQLANLYNTTLASGYTAGAGSISVASATGAPSSGTFSLTILNATTGAVILIFRVTSVSGTTFTGAAEGPDTNAAMGSVVVGTILTVAAVDQIKLDAVAGITSFIQPVTPPVAANFSQINFNTGTSVVTSQVNNSSPINSIYLEQNDPGGTTEIAGLTKAKLASTFTVTIGFSMYIQGAVQGLVGLWLTDGSSNNIIFCYQVAGNAFFNIRIPLFNNFAGSFNTDIITPFTPFYAQPLIWLRVQETASARNYSVSQDGQNFIQVFTESNTAHFTTVDYGWAAEVRGAAGLAAMTVYSFTETNP
jgi:hypothetical protein